MNPKFNIVSVNISREKGTGKERVGSAEVLMKGLAGDAHSGDWHRQVSLLGMESIRKFEKEAGRGIAPGEFAENLTTDGIELWKLSPLDRLANHNIEFEITQIGKECHGTSCSIFKEVGNCVMPKEGIFCRVIRGGMISAGDWLEYKPRIFKVLVITLSDRASSGVYEDKSGPRIAEIMRDFLAVKNKKSEIRNVLISDDPGRLHSLLTEAKEDFVDFIFTTGGTGIGTRDFTPEVIRPLLNKEIPGIMDYIRMKYAEEKPSVVLSRSIAGVMGESLVFALPGSVRAVNEYMTEIVKVLLHSKYMLHSLDVHG